MITRCDAIKNILRRWDDVYNESKQRIQAYIGLLIYNQSEIKKHGCPLTSLCSELLKARHALRDDAKLMIKLFQKWLIKQFSEFVDEKSARIQTMHLLGRMQGISSCTNIFNDINYIKREVTLLNDWVESL